MAVFTSITRAQLESWLANLPVGALQNFRGIAAGIENSNFFVTTDEGHWVLTLFERLYPEQLPFYLELMQHLAARGIPCPNPTPQPDQRLWAMLAERPATLVTRLSGASILEPSPHECAQVGALLARMHQAAADFPHNQANLRGPAWWKATAPRLYSFLDAPRQNLLRDEIAHQEHQARAWAQLPKGPIHADLFRDNVLFNDGKLSGVIDFYFAGVDTWLFDLAVTCNDWCIEANSGALIQDRLNALLLAYHHQRPVTHAEQAAWPDMLRAAALRFWVSRLDDWYCPRPAHELTPKDPAHFQRILEARRVQVPAFNRSLSDAPCR